MRAFKELLVIWGGGLLVATPLILPGAIAEASYKWPNYETDMLEEIYYQQVGRNGRRFGNFVATCDAGANNLGAGRTNAAEWLRLAYHDMATGDVEIGSGGLDASISFKTELDRPENMGSFAFTEALAIFGDFVSLHTSMADIIALGAVMSVTACTVSEDRLPVYLPLRAGRVDASWPGPAGVPEPHQDLATYTERFRKSGFNVSEMIALVACGHSLGGVNGIDNPHIVPVMDDPKLAASPDLFRDTCSRLLERMIDTVPQGVQLSRVITPISVKPDAILMEVDGASGNMSYMTIKGDLRVRLLSFCFYIVGRDTTPGVSPSACALPQARPLSSFTVEVVDTDPASKSTTTMHDNGGPGFPIETALIPQAQLSCTQIFFGSGYEMNLTVAVRDDAHFEQVLATVHLPVAQPGSVWVPRFEPRVLTMNKTQAVAGTGYSLYTAFFTTRSAERARMFAAIMSYALTGVSTGPKGNIELPFLQWKYLRGTCPP
ncbi:heme peroxidase [Apodospora peruviana]|uniref:Peroxidase n=1 Tax=Apodospora peruviana TaxID=516989 RepID=A0AAE0MG38_9PEZI|nr:heme peroxidase [Apodospora peruviana]